MGVAPRGRGLSLSLTAAACLLVLVPAHAQTPATPQFTIVAQSPAAEIKFTGVSLKSVRADDRQNTVALDFNGPISGTAFDSLQQALPDWVQMSYSGYDSAVIRATRPVTFLTRRDADGFSLRMMPRGAIATASISAPLRGAIADAPDPGTVPTARYAARPSRTNSDWGDARRHYATALAERPTDDGLRRGYDLSEPRSDVTAEAWAGWRKNHDGSTLIEGHAAASAVVYDNIAVTGTYDDGYVHAKNVRRLDGTFAPLDKNSASGAVGLAYLWPNGSEARGEVLYGHAGPGAALGVDTESPSQQWSVRGAYHETYADTAEAIADEAVRDYAEIDAAGRLLDGLWGTAELHLTRYGVHGDANLAHTAGFTASLAYLMPVTNDITAGATYTADGEYTLGAHKYPGLAPTPFIPLSIRTREVHSVTGSLNSRLLDDVWIDAYGGYALDRYGTQGAVYGGALRLSVLPQFDIVITGRHTQVADRQGETGPETQALLSLVYR